MVCQQPNILDKLDPRTVYKQKVYVPLGWGRGHSLGQREGL